MEEPFPKIEVYFLKPIPAPEENNISYHSLPIVENNERLISIAGLSPKIKIHSYYYETGISGALDKCYLREGTARKLIEAANLLPDGLFLIALDGFRPYEVQRELYEMIKQNIEKRTGYTGDRLVSEVAKFVAYPSDNIDTPSPHMSGGAIDVTIGRDEGWLDMGTEFDDFTEKAETAWFERRPSITDEEQIIRDNRRLLYTIMTTVGFSNYENEWWHYDYGNQRWAMMTNQTAVYKGMLSNP